MFPFLRITGSQADPNTWVHSVSELPHKHTYFATFLALLHAKPVLPAASSHSDSASKPERGLDKDEKDDAPASESKEDPEPAKDPEPPLNIALHVLQHLDSNLGVAVSQSDWRSVRFHLRFFALCAASLPNAMVDPDSLTNALGQLVDILKRSNVVLAVKDDVAKAVGETLLLLPLEDRNTPFRQALKEYQATRQLEEAHLILGPNRVDVSALFSLALPARSLGCLSVAHSCPL